MIPGAPEVCRYCGHPFSYETKPGGYSVQRCWCNGTGPQYSLSGDGLSGALSINRIEAIVSHAEAIRKLLIFNEGNKTAEQYAEEYVESKRPAPSPDIPPNVKPSPDAIFSTSFHPSEIRAAFIAGYKKAKE